MRFTIVTIAYNQREFVEQALRSVLDQDYPDIEYIVVDPGSTDGTREIIERYRDRLDRILYRADEGPAEGLNNGFAAATGEIFGFLNSDDLLLPGTIARVAKAFADGPRVDLVTGHMWIVDAQGRRVRRSFSDRFHPRAYAYGCCTICQQSTFFRAALFRQAGGFNSANRIAWDSELFLDMMQYARSHLLLDEILSGFRIHRESITGSQRNREIRRRFFHDRFRRVMGRDWRRSDRLVRLFYFARKYALQPRSLRERLRHGSIVTGRPVPGALDRDA
ncbi:glycosyltransferase family 2 protein [Sphingomonas sp.]|uniref:glycosyltransferase family 2 protein n=1 Tax=Sphingomonas sp. TaxID=28214 RepID=UPI001B2AE662|nr:glycosyltransferase family 2 protein [Sphingomonas sp.]MBO9714784.1 glycosyltransferase [Sphingomonas sp.]